MPRYRTVFTRQALEFICRANSDEMRELERWLDRLELRPGLPGDFAETGEDGRELQVRCIRGLAVTHWTDHAVREVRIVRIEPHD